MGRGRGKCSQNAMHEKRIKENSTILSDSYSRDKERKVDGSWE